MNKNTLIVAVVAALLVGVAVGYTIGTRGKGTGASATVPAAANVVELFRQAGRGGGTTSAQDACIRGKLGPERYAALALNPRAATAEDQFAILPCYRTP